MQPDWLRGFLREDEEIRYKERRNLFKGAFMKCCVFELPLVYWGKRWDF